MFVTKKTHQEALDRIRVLEKDLEEKDVHLLQQQRENEHMQHDFKNLQGDYRALQKQFEEMSTTINNLEGLKGQVKFFEAKIEDNKLEITTLESRINKRTAHLDFLKEQVQDEESSLNKITNERNQKSLELSNLIKEVNRTAEDRYLKATENERKLIEELDRRLESQKEQVKQYDINSVKNFIKSYANDTEIYKLYDDILINEIIVLSVKLNVTELSNQQLSKEFNKISNKIEKIYWERYVVNAEGFNWFIATKTINPWISLPGSLFLKTRKITEYTSIILAMATYLVLIESFISKGKGLFSYDTTITIVGFFIAVLILYFLLNGISTIFDKNPKMKNKRNIKKYEPLPNQLEDVDSA